MAADAHFGRAIDLAKDADGAEDVVARAEQNRALVLLLRGDALLAEATARRALSRFERIDEPAGVADSHWSLGVIALARGERLRHRIAALAGGPAADDRSS